MYLNIDYFKKAMINSLIDLLGDRILGNSLIKWNLPLLHLVYLLMSKPVSLFMRS